MPSSLKTSSSKHFSFDEHLRLRNRCKTRGSPLQQSAAAQTSTRDATSVASSSAPRTESIMDFFLNTMLCSTCSSSQDPLAAAAGSSLFYTRGKESPLSLVPPITASRSIHSIKSNYSSRPIDVHLRYLETNQDAWQEIMEMDEEDESIYENPPVKNRRCAKPPMSPIRSKPGHCTSEREDSNVLRTTTSPIRCTYREDRDDIDDVSCSGKSNTTHTTACSDEYDDDDNSSLVSSTSRYFLLVDDSDSIFSRGKSIDEEEAINDVPNMVRSSIVRH